MRFITAALVLWLGISQPAQARERPNILLVLSDDHSAAHVGAYGNQDIKTPNLDRFASQGMRCDRAYVACPQCVPSRAAIMTGRSPVAIQMTRFTAPLPAEVKVYPELLRGHGYYTGVGGRTYHLDGPSASQPEIQKLYEDLQLKTFARRLDYVKTARSIPETLSQLKEFLDAVPEGRPFVLQLCFSDPHRPLDKGAIRQPHDPAKLTLPPHYPDTQLVREDFARYYDEIGRVDQSFGQVLAELDQRHLADNTIVAFMGDNGASQLRGKGTLYEFGIHVPLLVRWPGHVRAGSHSGELISGEDLAPTFLQAAGLDVPRDMTGRSFLDLLLGQPYEPRTYVFAERGAHGSGLPTNSAAFDLGRAIVSKTHKLIYNALWQLPYTPVDFAGDDFWEQLVEMHAVGKLPPELDRLYFAPQREIFELYDLTADPAEMHNLIGRPEMAALERELKAQLEVWMIREHDFVPLPFGSEGKDRRAANKARQAGRSPTSNPPAKAKSAP
ncbi:MAG TPA: sulfatase [Pirellulales bacterium]|nr:sulfatase [Pirellulales bacterium]